MTHLKKFWWVYLLIVAAVATVIWKWDWIASKLGIGTPSVERARSRACAKCCTTQNVSCPNCDCSHYRVAGSPVLDANGRVK